MNKNRLYFPVRVSGSALPLDTPLLFTLIEPISVP
jgi:hypothetical protein